MLKHWLRRGFKGTQAAAAGLAALLTVSAAQAQEEELAPGFDQCMEASGGVTANMSACADAAYQYWDQQLNQNYRQAMQNCQNTEDPVKCQALLKKSERSWVTYKESLADYLILSCGGSAIGTLDLLNISIMMAEETKKQARCLAQ